jgi:hypothetical protein
MECDSGCAATRLAAKPSWAVLDHSLDHLLLKVMTKNLTLLALPPLDRSADSRPSKAMTEGLTLLTLPVLSPDPWIGCYQLDPSNKTDVPGAHNVVELTNRKAEVIEGQQWYHVGRSGSDLKYAGRWAPLTEKSIRLEIGSPGAGNITFVLSRSKDGLVGTSQEFGDVASSQSPHVAASLRTVACSSGTPKNSRSND